jgi:biotin carboxylase
MRNVVYVAPYPLQTTVRFARGIAQVPNVRLLGVFHEKPKGEAAALFDDVALIANSFDAGNVMRGIQALQAKYGPIHRVMGILEDLQVQLAQVRLKLGIPGTDPDTAHRFRDKGAMKDALRAAGLPCAYHARIHSMADAWKFVDRVGFPIILKPPAGAGSRDTFKVESGERLHDLLTKMQPSPKREWLAEEFLTGAEYTFETLTLNGEVKFHSICRYYPSPLEVKDNDHLQWCVFLPKDISGAEFADIRRIGAHAVKALGLGTSMTHMEWFRRPNGSIAIGEIGARPPGAQIVELMSQVYEVDMHHAWARLMIDDDAGGPWHRKWSAGVAFLRGAGKGRVTAVENLEAAQKKMGALVRKVDLPKVGFHRKDGYEGEGYAILRHIDDNVVRKALFELITTVKVRYSHGA